MAIWFRGGYSGIFLDTDLGRDLSELSNLMDYKIVWLGPRLSAGFPASPIYYYTFFPVLWLAQGDARSLILFNMVLAIVALGIFTLYGWRAWGKKVLLATWVLALSPWWSSTAIHPGNGYTYIFWLFGGLSLLWFEAPLFITSLLIGLAIAHHPAAVFVLPLLAFEVWRRRTKIKLVLQVPLIMVGLLLPWVPILAYEAITKGYLLRQFLANPETTYYFQLGFSNLEEMSLLSGLSFVAWLGLWFLSYFLAPKRLKVWFGLASLGLVSLSCVSALPSHYLLGVVTLTWFIMVLSFVQSKLGCIVLAVVLVAFITLQIMSGIPPTATRSIPSVENTVDTLISQNVVRPDAQIAVVSVMTMEAEVPQADDYRFFLRQRGFEVLDVANYAQANALIMFIEEPNFPWQTWSSWETDQFGDKKQVFERNLNGTNVVVYQKP